MSGKRELYCEVLGKKVYLPERCERIVSFSPAVTEALFLMGLADKVVGVSVWCVHPPEARQKQIVGSYSTAKEEKLRALKPDIIFTTSGYQLEFAKKLSERFSVWAVGLPASVSEIVSLSVEAGVVAGYYARARELEIKLFDLLAKTLAKVRRVGKRPRVYVEIDLGGPVTFGAFSYITDAIYLAGGENIFAEEPREWLEPDPKHVKSADPDIIIYEPKMFSKRGRSKEEVMQKLEARFGKLRAIREGKVFVTPGIYDFLAHHGPGFITKALGWLVDVINSA